MGLDMYLSAKHYVKNWDHMPTDERHDITITRGGQPTPIDPSRISEVVEDVGYWRKANAIHQWFVVNVQGGEDECREHDVTTEQLAALRDACLAVLADPAKALALLPPQAGFFFGSTDVDEGYFDDLRDTVAIIDAILAKPPEWRPSLYYQSSW